MKVCRRFWRLLTIVFLALVSVGAQDSNTTIVEDVGEQDSNTTTVEDVVAQTTPVSVISDVNNDSENELPSNEAKNSKKATTFYDNDAKTSTSTSSSKSTTLDPDQAVHQKWKRLIADAGNGVDNILRQVMPAMLSTEVDISTECTSSMFKIILGMRGLKKWVIELIDASGKIPSGILKGSVNSLGDYDECVDLIVTNDYSGKEEFKGQYCSVIVKLEIPPRSNVIDLDNFTDPSSVFRMISKDVFIQANSEFRLGICLPSTCTKQDVTNIFGSAVQNYPFKADVLRCETKPTWNLTWDQILVLLILTILAIILIASTITTHMIKEEARNAMVLHLMAHFCMTHNIKKLFRTEKNLSSLSCVNGIKVLCMMWIIAVHSYALIPPYSYANAYGILVMVRDKLFLPIANASLSVDSFFVAGGLMVSYLTLKFMAKSKGRIPLFGFIVRRLWRLLPGILVVMGGVMIMPLLGSGPLWEDVVVKEAEVCRRNWWATVLLINSWFDYFDMCMVHTWYLSNDMHFFLLSPILLYILYRKPIVGTMCVLAIITAGALTVGIITYTRDLHPSILISEGRNHKLKKTMEWTYFKPYAHVGPYYLGFMLGYVLFKFRDVHLNIYQQIAGWCMSTIFGLVVIYSPSDWYHGNLPPPVVSALFQSLHRIGFGLAICWVIFACAYGYGGFVNQILSWKGFSPLNRLTYLMYLVQMPVIWTKYGAKRDTIIIHHRDVIYEVFGNFIVTTAVAIILYIAVEAPFSSMDVEFFGKRMRAKRQPSEKRNVKPIPTLVITDETTPDPEKGIINGGFAGEQESSVPKTFNLVEISKPNIDDENVSQCSDDVVHLNTLNAVFSDRTPVATPIKRRRATRLGMDANDVELTTPKVEKEDTKTIESVFLSITNNYDNTPMATPIGVRKSANQEDAAKI